jgi:hypothetical protein
MYNNELYHYGVKGMKWGRRKKYYNSDGSLNELGQARQNYKNSKKAAKKSRGLIGKGVEGDIEYAGRYSKSIQDEATYKALKAKNAKAAQKAELKTYSRGMNGIPYKASRYAHNKLYDDIKQRKGKEFADKAVDNMKNERLKDLLRLEATLVGMTVASAIIISLTPE